MVAREVTEPANPRYRAKCGDELVVELLTGAYWMEIETAVNYLAASVNLEGIRAAELARLLGEEIGDELEHARRLADRLKELGGTVPGSFSFQVAQRSLQPRGDQTDLGSVMAGILEADEAAIVRYRDLIDQTDGVDWVTHDLAVDLLGDKESRRRRFQGYLREYARSAQETPSGLGAKKRGVAASQGRTPTPKREAEAAPAAS